MKTLIAIDPGKKGAIAVWSAMNRDDNVTPMPATLRDIIDYLKIFDDPIVYLEDVGVRPNQGSVSNKTFMKHQGNLEAVIMTLDYKLVYVKPQVWQRHLGLLSKKTASGVKETPGQHKMRIVAFSQQRYPHVEWNNEHGRSTKEYQLCIADALAILEYAKEKEKGESK